MLLQKKGISLPPSSEKRSNLCKPLFNERSSSLQRERTQLSDRYRSDFSFHIQYSIHISGAENFSGVTLVGCVPPHYFTHTQPTCMKEARRDARNLLNSKKEDEAKKFVVTHKFEEEG